MTIQAISAPEIFDGLHMHINATLLIKEKKVVNILKCEDLPSNISHHHRFQGTITPGFVDLQVNGGGGVLFNDLPTIKGIQTIINAHWHQGTQAILPTLITCNDQTILKALDAVEEGISQNIEGLLGIHLEGPMLNPARKGIHNENEIHPLSSKIIDQLLHRDLGKVIITLAPEMVDLALIKTLTDAGIFVFAGHTNATPERLVQAINHGLRGFTHIYNAMPQMESRHPNTTGFALQNAQTWGSIINDGFHVDPIMIDIAIRTKPKGKLFFVSDSMSTINSTQTEFMLDGKTIFRKNGRLIDSKGTLAGADISLANAVTNALQHGYSLEEALPMATLFPAQCLDVRHYGGLKAGDNAYINHYHNGQFTPLVFD